MDNAFNYAADNTLNTEDEYPYTAKSTLAYNCKAVDAGDVRISSHSDVAVNSPEALQAALIN